MIYSCCEDRRRNEVKAHGTLNGIDFLEVQDSPSDLDDLRQRTLSVHFIKDLPVDSITEKNVQIEGGVRIQNIKVAGVTIGSLLSPPLGRANVLVVEVSEPGDFSTYTLRLVNYDPPLKLDPLLSAVDFSFKVGCPSDFDCREEHVCPPEPATPPEFSYLAKDYSSFRQLMLERMSALMPGWTERNSADLGITLVELLAYVADYLSYQQDAVATEAYLGTARRRTSVRRHARLIDYFVHEGASARAWVQVQVAPGVANLSLNKEEAGFITRFITTTSDLPDVIRPDSANFQKAMLASPEQFELARGVRLFAEHNRMRFYPWGALACCLPTRATKATLRGAFPDLQKGDVLVLVEERGPLTGTPEDADPAHRHAVRLTTVTVSSDPLGGRFEEPPNDGPVEITEIEWGADDALPFPLCISTAGKEDDVSVAVGNITLVDHGYTVASEVLTTKRGPGKNPEEVPRPNPVLTRIAPDRGDHCKPISQEVTLARYRPALSQGPLTHVADYKLDDQATSASAVMRFDGVGGAGTTSPDNQPTSASAVMRWPADTPLPSIAIKDDGGESWLPLADLLASKQEKRFVVEVETDGTAWLRFGDDRFGAHPKSGSILTATYRVGNGTRGNVGRETLTHIISNDTALAGIVERVWNPMPARGGMEPESLEEVRQRAPSAFQVQERAVTPEDYADVIQRCRPDVQRAAATFRWTGSWRTVFLTADRLGGSAIDPHFASDLRACVEPYRMAGMDLEVESPIYVSLEIELRVCVNAAYFKGAVESELLEVFSNRVLPDGRKGLFHPDNFSFGQQVYLSPLYAAAQSADGVDSVRITKFQRQGEADGKGLDDGKLAFGPLEIARLDNDANFPEHGVFTLKLEGGR